MISDIDVLEKKISSLSEETKKYIRKENLWKKKYLRILNKNYPNLPVQHTSHEQIKLPTDISDEIISEMKKDRKVKNFLSIDLQHFLSLFENVSSFMRYFKREVERSPHLDKSECERLIREIQNICLEDYDEENYSIKLKIFRFFGFMHPNFDENTLDLDEPKIFFIKFLQMYFFRNLRKFQKEGERVNFRLDIREPFIKICDILKINGLVVTDNYGFVYLEEEKIEQKLIQDFFCCFQYHYFFEIYVNNLFKEKGTVLENPLIIFNPSEREDREGTLILEGYFELDGSLCITKDEKLILIECKNGDRIHPKDLTNFIGKSRLIEKIYGLNIDKLLFSTGSRFELWEKFEDYTSCSDIRIFCRKSFIENFSDLRI